jgi:hypothetical protein
MVKKYNYNFISCFVLVSNLAPRIKRRNRLRVFETRVLRGIFALIEGKWQEAGENCTMKSSIICSSDIIRMAKSRRMRWAGHVVLMTEMRNVYKIFVGKPKGKSLLRRPKRRRENNIKTHLREVGCESVGWVHLAQDRTDGGFFFTVTTLKYVAVSQWLVGQ